MKHTDAMRQLYRLEELHTLPRASFNDMDLAAKTIRLACGRLSRIGEMRCNGIVRYQGNGIYCGTWTEADDAKADKDEAKQEARVLNALRALWGDLPFDVEFQGDPRGAPVIIHTKGTQDRLASFW